MNNNSKIVLVALTSAVAVQGYAFPEYAKKGGKAGSYTHQTKKYSKVARKKKVMSSVDQIVPQLTFSNDKQIPEIGLSPLKKHESASSMQDSRDAISKLDIEQVKAELKAVMTDSKEFWPADYGHYGPLFIRLAWHSAGTYRSVDGRGGADGGQMRFYPLANWPDNANLDKARKLIQPVVDKHYPKLTWADAMVLVGDLAMQDMGFETRGVALGRVDDKGPDLVYWGPEDEFLKSERFDENGNLQLPLAASVMGLIYVNPEGPDGKPDPLLSAERIRTTFGRMGMNDEEVVALIAGGHTFGKMHGAPKPEECQGKSNDKNEAAECPEAKGPNANTSGLEGAWSPNPVKWTHEFLTNLYKYDWELSRGPGGKYQWFPKDLEDSDKAPDAHDPSKLVTITMLTTDLALKEDPKYKVISQRFLENPTEFENAFADAWFKLTHRDMGPKSRYMGSDFPAEDFVWQDPIPEVEHALVNAEDIASIKVLISESELSVSDRVKTAWAAAASFRGTDMRGGVNGGRLYLEPQKSWEVNEPELLERNLSILEGIQAKFNSAQGRGEQAKKISLADLIVLSGASALEEAAKKAGFEVEVPFTPGRADASQEQTDVESFEFLKVTADGFRNYFDAEESYMTPERAFVDRADLLNLDKQEMAVLTAGLRVLGANHENSSHGVLTKNVGTLSNDFFINVLDANTTWSESEDEKGVFIGLDKKTREQKWTATSQDLVFGANPDLRIVSFSYGTKNAGRKFVADFVEAWTKVMNLDRFDASK